MKYTPQLFSRHVDNGTFNGTKTVAVKFDEESRSYIAGIFTGYGSIQPSDTIMATGEAMSVEDAIDIAVDNFNNGSSQR